ncbi:hypothetical protein AVEN_26259-1 [Araneus ventricosus]|uniref:Uncharacterized protein n=1 Tax=Araneus ventricosus TaxID=182803 RepID=A0A4Y2ALV3_ARAVE|nr:hypothetical protein AVEN_26259-1 [Araneus ventricosus]
MAGALSPKRTPLLCSMRYEASVSAETPASKDVPKAPKRKFLLCRSLQNESADMDPQKELLDPIPTKRNEYAKGNESADMDPQKELLDPIPTKRNEYAKGNESADSDSLIGI